jgi:cytochrome c oxidase subunit II
MSAVFAFLGFGGGLPAASDVAPRVDHIINGLLAAGTAMVVLLTVLTLFILVRYRRGSAASRRPVGIATWKIEATWITGTLVVFLVFFFQGAGVYADMERIPPGLPEIAVTGRQWMWDVRYPDGRREFNTLHVRQGAPVRIVLSSEDVIHSFFVPAFRIKQDVVPGRIVSTWFNPTRAGSYALFCAQYCGTAHAQMIGTIVVLPPADYAAWAQGEPPVVPSGTPESRGLAAYRRYGCAECHDDPLGRRGPRLRGLYGSVVPLADGERVRADEQYLHDAILLAPKYKLPGYALTMPTYDGIMAPADAMDLIAFVKSLPSTPPKGAHRP